MGRFWKIIYYISTVLLSISMLVQAYFDFFQLESAKELFVHLGYPLYVSSIIGAAKFLGVIGLWQNKVSFLREWAYAGFFIDFTGALISHLAVGDGIAVYGGALLHLAILLVSYASFRKLGLGDAHYSPQASSAV